MRFNLTNEDEQKKRVAIPMDNQMFLKDFDDSLSVIGEKRKELNDTIDAFFKKKVSELFGAMPELEFISIIQYTPYFLDGDACEFSISSVSFGGQDDLKSAYDISIAYGTKFEEVTKKISSFIFSNEDYFKNTYGDHALVVITRDGTEIEEYEHD